MLIRVCHRVVLAELLIGTVICIDKVTATGCQPALGCLDTKVIVTQLRQLTLSIAALQNALGQSDRCGDAVSPHLLHGSILVLFCVFSVLSHSQLSFQSMRLFIFVFRLLRRRLLLLVALFRHLGS